MGEEIKNSQFCKADFEEFSKRLRRETALLGEMFADGAFNFTKPKVGFELETWLVSPELQPAPINEALISQLKSPKVVHELSRFNVEFNSDPHAISGKIYSTLLNELQSLWQQCQTAAQKLNAKMVMIGMLPTLKQSMLGLEKMSDSERYAALNKQVFFLRKGKPILVDIEGIEHLSLTHFNILIEAAATSLQIHLNLPQESAVRFFNAASILSAPMVALGANSPFLFGKDLWAETRIPMFEQAVSLPDDPTTGRALLPRVTLGTQYLTNSLMEAFEENLQHYPPLLPILFEEPAEQLRHLTLHNGTIWRWNRPLIGREPNGKFHLRLEHRVVAAGPTPVDVVANIAFFIGAIYALIEEGVAPENRITFEQSKENFYQAARFGLDAEIHWLDGKKVTLQKLLSGPLLEKAKLSLAKLGVQKSEIQCFIDGVILPRVESGQNGSSWQRRANEKFKHDFEAVTASYVDWQATGKPVHEWSV